MNESGSQRQQTGSRVRNISRLVLPIFSVLLFAFLQASGSAAGSYTLKTSLHPQTVYLGSSLLLEVEVQGTARPDKAEMAANDSFLVEPLPGEGADRTSLVVVDGKITEKPSPVYYYRFRLTPVKSGKLEIPPVSVAVADELMHAAAGAVMVLMPEQSDDFKMSVELSKSSLYVGEDVTVIFTIYMRGDFENITIDAPFLNSPHFQFDVPDPLAANGENRKKVMVNQQLAAASTGTQEILGKQFTTLTVTQVVRGKAVGKYEWPGFTASADIFAGYEQTPIQSSDTAESIRQSYFGMNRKKAFRRVIAQAQPVTVTVRDLPGEGRPEGFTGLIGKYRLSASAAPCDVNVGEPITLTITIAGTGNLDKVQLPFLNTFPDLVENFKIGSAAAAGTVEGDRKVFVETLRPLNAAVGVIPPVTLVYFDPEAGDYRVAASQTIPIKVSPASASKIHDEQVDSWGAALKPEAPVPVAGLAHNYVGDDLLEDQHFEWLRILQSPLWICAFLGSFMLYLTLYVAQSIRQRKHAAPAVTRSKKALARFTGRIHRINRSATVSSDVCTLLQEALREYLGDKLNVTGAALTYSDVYEPLREHGVDDDALAEIRAIFDACDRVRYSSEVEVDCNCQQLVRQVSRLIKTLDRSLR